MDMDKPKGNFHFTSWTLQSRFLRIALFSITLIIVVLITYYLHQINMNGRQYEGTYGFDNVNCSSNGDYTEQDSTFISNFAIANKKWEQFIKFLIFERQRIPRSWCDIIILRSICLYLFNKFVTKSTSAPPIGTFMNQRVHPCNDFYEYVCGNRSVIRTHKTLGHQAHNNFKFHLTEAIEKENTIKMPKAFKGLRKFYQLCMDRVSIIATSQRDLRDILNVIGGWNQNGINLTSIIIKLNKQGLHYEGIVKFNLKQHIRLPQRYSIEITPPLLNDPWIEMLNLNDLEYMIEIAERSGLCQPNTVDRIMRDIYNFQIALTQIIERPARPSRTTERVTIQKAMEKYPYIDWQQLIDQIFINDPQFTRDQIIIIRNPWYFEQLEVVLQAHRRTIPFNYLIWKALQFLFLHLVPVMPQLQMNPFADDSDFDLYNLKMKCILEAKYLFPLLLEALYIRNYFDRDTEKIIMDMFKNIKKEFLKIIDNLKWMDSSTKQMAKKKVTHTTLDLKFKHLRNNGLLNKLYLDTVADSPNLYIKAIVSAQKQLNKFAITTIPYLQGPEASQLLDLETEYWDDYNLIKIAGFKLEKPLFSAQWNNYINVGTMGSVLSHEISHSIQGIGAFRDENGVPLNESWWSSWTTEEYQKATDCIINQFNNFRLKGHNLNGTITLDENMADSSAMKILPRVYEKYYSKEIDNYSPESRYSQKMQKLFIYQAMGYCKVVKKHNIENLHQLPHSPDNFRIIATARNSEDFAKAFECPTGSPMNPRKKCQIF